VHAALAVGLGAASVLNFAFGVPTTGMATAIGAVVCALAWRIAAGGRIDASAVLSDGMTDSSPTGAVARAAGSCPRELDCALRQQIQHERTPAGNRRLVRAVRFVY